jgi:hypothetical protein
MATLLQGQPLPLRGDGLRQKRLRIPHGTERDSAIFRPVQLDCPAKIRPIEIDFLVLNLVALDPSDRNVVDRRLKIGISPIDSDLRVGYAVEYESRRSDLECRAAIDTAQPLQDEVEPEHEVAGPIVLLWLADPKLDPPDMAVVPGHLLEVGFCLCNRHQLSSNAALSGPASGASLGPLERDVGQLIRRYRLDTGLRKCASSHFTISVLKSGGICPPGNAGP